MAESTDIEYKARACAAARLLGLRAGMEGHPICAGLNELQQPIVYCSSLVYVQSSACKYCRCGTGGLTSFRSMDL